MEILIVITIFAVLGMIVTRSVILTLQGSQKSESMVSARENLDYSLGVIERQIRNANSIPNSSCTGVGSTSISYIDQNGSSSYFSCVNTGSVGSYIASESASVLTKLTNSNIKINSCSFTCIPSIGSNPPQVDIDITVQNTDASGVLGSAVSASTQIYLRNY